MMRISDGIFSIYDGLVALPWRPSYLAALWILGGELQSLYEPWISDEVPLMASTMDLVREVAIAGESPQAATRARELADSWDPAIEAPNDEAPAGLGNVFSVFQGLALEIAYPTIHYDAANWVGNAAENRWRDRNDPGPLDGQADDSSPMAQTLTLFRRIVSAVAAHNGPETDPVRIREQILGPRLLRRNTGRPAEPSGQLSRPGLGRFAARVPGLAFGPALAVRPAGLPVTARMPRWASPGVQRIPVPAPGDTARSTAPMT